MKRFALLPLVVVAGCASDRDPYAVSPEEGKAAAAKVRPKLPPDGLPPLRADRPTQIPLSRPLGGNPPADGKDTIQPPPGATPSGQGEDAAKGGTK